MDKIINAREAGPFKMQVGDRLLIPRFAGTAGIGNRKLESPHPSVDVVHVKDLPGDEEKYGGEAPSYAGYKFNAPGHFQVVTGAVGGNYAVNIQFGFNGGPLSLCYAEINVQKED